MTSTTVRTKGFIDCTRGVSREQRALNRRNKLESQNDRPKRSRESGKGFNGALKRARRLQQLIREFRDAEDRRCQAEEELFYKLPDRVVTESVFEEKLFGHHVAVGEHFYHPSDTEANDLSSIVASFALYDGDRMLFECSGIPLPPGETLMHLTRFVTSSRLVDEFNANRNKDDKLRVEVCFPDGKIRNGFLGLYDKDIAIVTTVGLQDVFPICLDRRQATLFNPSDRILTFGRAFKADKLMYACGYPSGECPKIWVPDSEDLTEAVLGGPLIREGKFLGMIHGLHHDGNVQYALFLPQELLCERLEHFQILNPKELHFREFSLPENVSSILPSGFIKVIRRLESKGYPLPPPLVLEFNGRLLNKFEDKFGDLRAWTHYKYGAPSGDDSEYVWHRLPKKVRINISRRVVSLASFNGHKRSFACTGWLIKWHGSLSGKHAVILTSASLVRKRDNEDEIDDNLMITVRLPPDQHGEGILEFFDLNYNIAVVSVGKFHSIRAEDIFNREKFHSIRAEDISNKVVTWSCNSYRS